MKYDISLKRLAELDAPALFRHLLHSPLALATILEDLPQETVSVKRSDLAKRVRLAEREAVVVMEFLTFWNEDTPWDLLMHVIRYERRYRLECWPVMVLLMPDARARSECRNESAHFRFELVKLWELPARQWMDLGAGLSPALLPLVPLLAGGLEQATQVERRLVECPLPPADRGDLLTIFVTLLGLRDRELAGYIEERCGKIMLESPIYQSILEKGREQGREEGRELGREEGCLEAISSLKLALELRFGPAAYELFSLVDACHDLPKLAAVRQSLKTASIVSLKVLLTSH